MSEAEAEIRELIDARIAAIKAKDAAAANEFLADDVVAFEVTPPLALPAGAARDVKQLSAWLDRFKEIQVEVEDLSIEAGDRVAFAHAVHRLVGTAVGGQAVNARMRSTLCFRREAEGWKIAHSHTSVPFRPDRAQSR